jgi:hypothetical protein
MVRRVCGAGGEIHECRLVGRHRLLVLDPGARLVGHVRHEMVVGIVREFDLCCAVEQERRPLVRLAAEEAIELVKALARRPTVGRTGDARLPNRGLVPFAEGARGIAIEAQHLGQRSGGGRDLPGGAGEAGRHFRDEPHVHGVMVAPGLERRARGGAQCRGVEVGVAQAVFCKFIQCLHGHRPAERIGHAKSKIVDQHDDHVRRTGGRLHLEAGRHLRVAGIDLGNGRPRRHRHRQHAPIKLHLLCPRGMRHAGACHGKWQAGEQKGPQRCIHGGSPKLAFISRKQRRELYLTISISPGRHVLSNHGSSGP